MQQPTNSIKALIVSSSGERYVGFEFSKFRKGIISHIQNMALSLFTLDELPLTLNIWEELDAAQPAK